MTEKALMDSMRCLQVDEWMKGNGVKHENNMLSLEESGGKADSESSVKSFHSLRSDHTTEVADHYTYLSYGFQLQDTYEHAKNNAEIMGVIYNSRTRQFVILDPRGITTWKPEVLGPKINRVVLYPKYEHKLITSMLYVKKYNCYLILTKDFSLKVLNRDFDEVCSANSELMSASYMVFNSVTDELITGGISGAKVWMFHQVQDNMFQEIKPLANYQLILKHKLPNMGGSWVQKIELDAHLQYLYCCSEMDLFVYKMDGTVICKIENAHTSTITGCCYSTGAKVFITSSMDTKVKVWSMAGKPVHMFRGHAKPVTNLLIHPSCSFMILTASLEGTIRIWSLEIMESIYSLAISTEGILWMGLIDNNLLFASTAQTITTWLLNHFVNFWAMTRCRVLQLSLVGAKGKTTRVMSFGEDGSIRLFSRKFQKKLSTVLPLPDVSPLETVFGFCYTRELNIAYVLMNSKNVWVYTTRTDPACRVAVWNIQEIETLHLQHQLAKMKKFSGEDRTRVVSSYQGMYAYRAIADSTIPWASCSAIGFLSSPVIMWTDEGACCPDTQMLLLLGLEDGRILFMDPIIKGYKYMEFRVCKAPVLKISHDTKHGALVTCHHRKDLAVIQFWDLPDLKLQSEVHCEMDVVMWARLDQQLFTGHSSGRVHLLTLRQGGENQGPRAVPELGQMVDLHKQAEHHQPVSAIDVCEVLSIFCSCSGDGAIKIWDSQKCLLTEILLNDTLSTVCFLNNRADLLVGFKNHVFIINHTKVCPHTDEVGSDEDADIHFCDTESAIYEDPSIRYESLMTDPVDLSSYLVPYKIEFSKEFLEGHLLLHNDDETKEQVDYDSAEETVWMKAPTEIYNSPITSPQNMSYIDLLLDMEPSEWDWQPENNSTEHMQDGSQDNEKPYIKQQIHNLCKFPIFGKSPVSTPPSSPLSAVSTDSDGMLVLQDGKMEEEKGEVEQEADKYHFEPISAAKETSTSDQLVKPQPVKKEEVQSIEIAKDHKYGLKDIKLNLDSLLIKTKGQVTKGSAFWNSAHMRSDLSQTEKLTEDKQQKGRREQYMKKKKKTGSRRVGHRLGQRPQLSQKLPGSNEQEMDEMKAVVEQVKLLSAPNTNERSVDEEHFSGDLKYSGTSGVVFKQMPFGVLAGKPEVSPSSVSEITVQYTTVKSTAEQHPETEAFSAHINGPSERGNKTFGLPCSTDIEKAVPGSNNSKLFLKTDIVQETSEGPGLERQKVQAGSAMLGIVRPVTTSGLLQRTGAPRKTFPRRRPQTVQPRLDNLDNTDLQKEFEEKLRRYNTNLVWTKESANVLFKNDGTCFDEDWHTRILERHRLIKMQKELRTKNAAQKRQEMKTSQKERFQQKVSSVSIDDASVAPICKVNRTCSDVSCLTKAVPSHISEKPNSNSSSCLPPNNWSKIQLHTEQPFRFSLQGRTPPSAVLSPQLEPWMFDPRNPQRNIKQPFTKSIPSNSKEYMLLSEVNPKDEYSFPSVLEEQLLLKRFPVQAFQVLQHHNLMTNSRGLQTSISCLKPVMDL